MNTLMETIELTLNEQQFLTSYLEAVFFTDTGDLEQPPSDAELDQDFLRESTIDCLAFYSRIECYLPDGFIGQAGHDFWLTRNGHGTGFWDRDYLSQTILTKFSDIAKSFGEADSVFDTIG